MLSQGGVATYDGMVDIDPVMDVGEAHDHALPDLNIAIDEAGVAYVRVLDYHALFDAAVPAYRDVTFQQYIASFKHRPDLGQRTGMNPLIGLVVVLAVKVFDPA
jgi:hypothetical protein